MQVVAPAVVMATEALYLTAVSLTLPRLATWCVASQYFARTHIAPSALRVLLCIA